MHDDVDFRRCTAAFGKFERLFPEDALVLREYMQRTVQEAIRQGVLVGSSVTMASLEYHIEIDVGRLVAMLPGAGLLDPDGRTAPVTAGDGPVGLRRAPAEAICGALADGE